MTTTYRANVTRDGGMWAVEVEGVPGGTFARTLATARARTYELVSVWAEVDEDEIDLVFDVEGTAGDVAIARERRRRADELEAAASALQLGVAARLSDVGVSTREIADVLGLSHQRVHQLLTRAS